MNVHILEKLGLDQVDVDAESDIIKEGRREPKVFVLISGKVVIKAKDYEIAMIDAPGAIFGEISALMGSTPVATVTTVEPSSFYIIEDFMDFIHKNPEACVAVAQVLACRVVNMNNHLVHIKDEINSLQKGLENYLPIFPERLEAE